MCIPYLKNISLLRYTNPHLSFQRVRNFLVVITSKITVTDQYSQYNNNDEVWHIARITKVWHRHTLWANTLRKKMMSVDLLNAKLPQSFNFFKKAQYPWSTVKQSTVKQGVPVNCIGRLSSLASYMWGI